MASQGFGLLQLARFARRAPVLRLALMFRDAYARPGLLSVSHTRRVLVLAPHMDDEALGCGGALLEHVRAGAQCVVAYLTDGSMGDRRLYDGTLDAAQRHELRKSLTGIRKHEAIQWCRHAGIADARFLDGPDGGLSRIDPAGPLVRAMSELINSFQPEVIYLPSLLETHSDHVATNRLAAAALRVGRCERILLRGYEVWNPLAANKVLDITDVFDRKMQLLKLFESQLADIDYGHLIGGLNAYRAVLLPTRRGYAEAFHELGVSSHFRLINRIPPENPRPTRMKDSQ